ncbi:hypothetical protein C3K47_18900 [Solitalea longa]|uniref:Uncharacterized protein n=1 Tax=Solitalea longa TaxID=2079460 RepID=A0A2S4ZWF6_9SPHI|nr:hypothetical protein [Solitalea longa]POY34704.1 hypothetical protein C3K47_18900 [Solitalea longa]
MEELDLLKEYKLELLKVYEKSQETFEKQLSYISAGALGASMLFIEKIVKDISLSHLKWMLCASWFFLGLTLVVNLISHLLSARNTYKTIQDIDNEEYDATKASRRNQFITNVNYGTVGTFLLGIIFLILFVTINIYKMKNNSSNSETNPTRPITGVIPPPPPSNPSPSPKEK